MKRVLALSVIFIALFGAINPKNVKAKAAGSYRMTVLRTAYCLKGIMANGHRVHPGAIATDPNVIPMGTHIFVPGYGHGRAEDTGSAVKGRHIDVWVSSCRKAMTMTRYVTITIYA